MSDDREPKTCPRCGQRCSFDGWDHVHSNGVGVGSCPAIATIRPTRHLDTDVRPVSPDDDTKAAETT